MTAFDKRFDKHDINLFVCTFQGRPFYTLSI